MMTPGAESSSQPVRRDHWRTLRTITCELRALTGPTQRPGFGRPLAAPEMVVELPRFQGHMLGGPVLPMARPLERAVERSVERPRFVTQAEPSYLAWMGPLMLFAITGILLGSIIALASG